MKELVFNHDNLLDSEINEVVTRCKGLIINDNNEILLGYCNKTYQFPGGHLESDEAIYDCLKREIKEETGIILEKDYEPFLLIKYYTKGYRRTNKNRLNKIYFFRVDTNKKYDLSNISLDEGEIKGNYTLKYININDLEEVLDNSINDNPINEIVVKEMKSAIKFGLEM